MNAQSKMSTPTADTEFGGPSKDGGYFVSAEAIERLGDGDIKTGRRRLRMLLADEQEQRRHIGPTPMPKTVRFATEKDELAVLTLLVKTCSMETTRWMPVSPERILDHVQKGTRADGGIVGVIDGPNDSVIGVTVMLLAQPAHSIAYYLQDIFNAVHPAHRHGTNHGNDLIQFGHACSDDMSRKFGYPVHIVSGVNSVGRMREKIRLFRRRNTQIGATFVYPSP